MTKKRIKLEYVLAAWFLLTLIKTIVFVFSKFDYLSLNFGGGNDSDYYDAVALSHADYVVNIWPAILNYLNQFGLYSRTGVSYFLFILSIAAIPLLTYKNALINKPNRRMFWLILLLTSAYPTLYMFTFDLYRDVFMLFALMIGFIPLGKYIAERSQIKKLAYLLAMLAIGFFLFALREYLGAAYFIALFWTVFGSSRFVNKIERLPLILIVVFYFATLLTLYEYGFIDNLVQYREGFDPNVSGTTFGIVFDSFITFIPKFLVSFLFQVFGLWLLTPSAFFVFFTESLPFSIGFVYILKNIKYTDRFSLSLLVFFVAYNSIWIIGNDNLGTAVRLRMLGYFPLLVVFFRIYQQKLSLHRIEKDK